MRLLPSAMAVLQHPSAIFLQELALPGFHILFSLFWLSALNVRGGTDKFGQDLPQPPPLRQADLTELNIFYATSHLITVNYL